MATVSAPNGTEGGQEYQGAFAFALRDLLAALAHRDYWLYLGMNDIRQRYRRSFIGPLWVTLTLGATVTGVSLVYGAILQQPFAAMLTFVALGLIFWQFFSGVLAEGCGALADAASLVTQTQLPVSAHVLRVVTRQVVVLGHNMLVFVALLPLWLGDVGPAMLLALPGVLLALLCGAAGALLLALACARFRDVSPMVANGLQLAFFVSPIFWRPDLLGEHAAILALNPFHHLLEVTRGPLLGTVPEAEHWLVSGGLAMSLWVLALAALGASRRRLSTWL